MYDFLYMGFFISVNAGAVQDDQLTSQFARQIKNIKTSSQKMKRSFKMVI